jgi:signal transduction histidine kinase/HAMP domain-containing protein
MQSSLRRRLVFVVVLAAALVIVSSLLLVLSASAGFVDAQTQLALRQGAAREAALIDSALREVSSGAHTLARLATSTRSTTALWTNATALLTAERTGDLAIERATLTQTYRENTVRTLAFRQPLAPGLAPFSSIIGTRTPADVLSSQFVGGRGDAVWSSIGQPRLGGPRGVEVTTRFDVPGQPDDGLVTLEVSQASIERLLDRVAREMAVAPAVGQVPLAELPRSAALLLSPQGDLIAARFTPDLRAPADDALDALPARLLGVLGTADGNAVLFDNPLGRGSTTNSVFMVESRLESADWRLLTLTPYNSLIAPLGQRVIGGIYLSMLGVIALGAFVYAWSKGRISDPLVELTTAAQEIGSGDLRYTIAYQARTDEVGGLARALDAMKSNLADSYESLSMWSRTLERRVEERTNEADHARTEAQALAQELRLVYNTSLSIVGTASLSAVLNQLVGTVPDLLKATYCSVWLLTDDMRGLVLAASTGETANIGRTIGLNEGLAGETLSRGEPIRLDDYALFNNRIDWLNSGFRRAVSVPLIANAPDNRSSVIGALLAGRDITAEPFSTREQRLLSLLANLVSPLVRNAQLFDALDEAVRRAESANAVKTRFLASVTHELRTPLNLIINNADFMKIGAFGEVNEEQHSRLEQTTRSAEHLLYLINDLLDVSKIEAGEMQLFFQLSDLGSIIEDTIDSAYALMDPKRPVELVTVIPDHLPAVEMDARRVRQILTNLLSNAIKFTKQGEVRFEVRIGESAGEGGQRDGTRMVQFIVKDTGIGIAPEDQARIFEAFERTGRARQEGIEGTGLGLSISRYLAEAHAGTLSLTSQVGVGSTFIFTLPMYQPSSLAFLVAEVDDYRDETDQGDRLADPAPGAGASS